MLNQLDKKLLEMVEGCGIHSGADNPHRTWMPCF